MTQNWESILVVASALVAVGAMIASFSQARSAKGAAAEAKRSADASETSAEAAARSAAADEEIARITREAAARDALRANPWKVQPVGQSRRNVVDVHQYALIDASDESVMNVILKGVGDTRFQDGETVRAGGKRSFYARGGTFVTVAWERHNGARYSAEYSV
ncbi:hypothetical protein ACWGKS_28485 [Nocardiopsis sp. NPDC055879]